MKLKQTPEDFRVEERTEVKPGKSGPFGFYRLEKSNWTTPDAIGIIQKRWRLEFRHFAFGGLKDRHAHTIQYLTIFEGPKRNLTHPNLTLTYLGQLGQEFRSEDIRANHFSITLRQLSVIDLEYTHQALEEIASVGVPNYFDDQRFGSVGNDQSFIAKHMVLGNFEEALRIALWAPYEHDRADAKKEKKLLREHWRNWQMCRNSVRQESTRRIFEHLVHHPDDFRGALSRLRPELQGLYLAAWQSHLWNRVLALWLDRHVDASQLGTIALQLGDLPVPRMMPLEVLQNWEKLDLPLPSARLRLDPEAVWAPLIEEIMGQEGIPLDQMKIKGMDRPFFSKGDRPALTRPQNLQRQIEVDERHPEHSKLILQFELPRGAYATVIIKRITQRPANRER